MGRKAILVMVAIVGTMAGCRSDPEGREARAGSVADPAACQPGEKCEMVVGIPVSAPSPIESPTPPGVPGPEIQCNGVDEDGDGVDNCGPDTDGDGVVDAFDCAPKGPAKSPLAPEIRCDGIDQNCDGHDDCDSDGDGVLDDADCDPADPKVTTQCYGPARVID